MAWGLTMRTKRIPLLVPILRAAALGSTMLVGLGAPPAAAGENCGSGTGSGITQSLAAPPRPRVA